jgi:16S rRNA (cytidine1402-2'-O)-methyltransferase
MEATNDRGRLFICPTPIGNLEDITIRAKRILSEVETIAAEDTRHTRQLLSELSIDTPMVSFHEHNKEERVEELLQELRAGRDIALVSDAGTPGIADPGYTIVRAAVEAGFCVVPLPGAVAAMVALSGSGFPTDRFTFHGFVPRGGRSRQQLLDQLVYAAETAILYESPHRIRRLLEDLGELMPERPVVVARELTKRYEEFHRGTAGELAVSFPEKKERGEMVVLVHGAPAAEQPPGPEQVEDLPLDEQHALLVEAGIDRMEALKIIARGHGLPKNAVYRAVMT